MPLLNQSLVIPTSSTIGQSVCVPFQTQGDDIHESDETLTITLRPANSNDVIDGVSSLTITIQDDGDSKRILSSLKLVLTVTGLIFVLEHIAKIVMQERGTQGEETPPPPGKGLKPTPHQL